MIRFFWMTLLLSLTLLHADNACTKNSFKVLCYHNVTDKITDPKIMTVTTDELIAHFKWLKIHHYHVISIDDILAAGRGEKVLPENAVLLTFDDGYVSFYTRIYPLLKLYHYPAVYALVGKWQETPQGKMFMYGNEKRSRRMLLSWDEIKEMMQSGLIEFASHTYDSHHGILGNPQGNTQPAITTLRYDPKTKSYESTEAYIRRIQNDLKKSSDIIYRHTGKRPRVIAWPYGAYNGIAQAIARKNGMPVMLTLDDGTNTPYDLASLKRILINSNPKFQEFYWGVENDTPEQISPQHTLFVDIDEVYDDNPKIANKKLGLLIEKIRKFKISTIVLKGYSDLDKDGYADTLYFPNRQLPMRSDFLNRVAWQLKSRAPIEDVYVRMPLYAFEKNDNPVNPADAKGEKILKEIYFDLSKQSFFKGILFDDTSDPENLDIRKVRTLTKKLYKSVRYFSGNIKTALMIDSGRFLQTSKPELEKSLKSFTYLYIDTQKLLHDGNQRLTPLSRLSEKIAVLPEGRAKCVVALHEEGNDDKDIIRRIDDLLAHKIIHIGYAPSRFVDSFKSHSDLIKVFSLRTSPLEYH